jgi:hypothetical protein
MISKFDQIFIKITLTVICIGIYIIVFQNLGIIPISQKVLVTGGLVEISGSIDIGNTVEVEGSLDVNIDAINGNRNAFYDFGGNKNYVRIPVYTGN